MPIRPRLALLCTFALAATGCSDDDTNPVVLPTVDAATQDAGPADAAATADASAQNCSGADPISQLLCQLTPAGGTEAQGQASLEELLTTLSGLAGIFGVTGGGGRADAGGLGGLFDGGAAPGAIDCSTATDRFAQLFCGAGRDGGPGPFGRRDAGPPAPPAVDAGASLVDSAGVSSEDASADADATDGATTDDASTELPDGGDASP